MPPQEQIPTTIDPMKMYGTQQPQKKKYQMIESVVKEEDEEYEESKSFMESRQKTLSKHEEGISCFIFRGLTIERADLIRKR